MARLYNRQARLTVIAPSTKGYTVEIGNPRFFVESPNATIVTDLRVQFKVEKSIDQAPNKLKVTTFNLAESTRSLFCTRPLSVRLDAGYDGNLRHMFTGDLRMGWSELKNTDWLTHQHLADGDRAYRGARMNHSYKRGTPVLQALRDAAKSLGLVLPPEIVASQALQEAFASGEVCEGPTRDELTRLLAPYNYTWSIQNGKLQILRDEEVRADQLYVIEESAGMIGSPEFSVPDQPRPSKTGKPGKVNVPKIKVRCILFPELQPGGRIEVRSAAVDGNFKIQKVAHEGDTHGNNPMTTEIEANAL